MNTLPIPMSSLTEYPIIDGVIWCVLSSIAFHFIGDFEERITQLFSWIGIYPPQTTLYVNRYTNSENWNDAFDAITHYITTHELTSTGTEVEYDGKDLTKFETKCLSYVIHPGASIAIVFKDTLIHIEMHEKDTKKDTERFYVLWSYTHTNTILKEFIQFCLEELTTHLEKQEWTSTRYTFDNERWVRLNIKNTRWFKNVVLRDTQLEDVVEDLSTFYRREEWYASRGIAWTRGYLLYGPPGTGKTSLIKAISNEFMLPIYTLNLTTLNGDENLRKAFMDLPTRCLLVLEDVDRMGNVKPIGQEDDTSVCSTISLSGLLNELDGISNSHGRVIVMTTNHIEKLDPAMIRPGRIDKKIYMGLCTIEMIQNLWNSILEVPFPPIKGLQDDVLTPAQVLESLMGNDPARRLEELFKDTTSSV